VTGGAGFIGSHFVRYILANHDYTVINLDALKYSGNLNNISEHKSNSRHVFIEGDICDISLVSRIVSEYRIDTIVNFAAETHVDRSIKDPSSFIQSNVYGTYVLLECARKFDLELMIQISTDEVYGSIEEGKSLESDPLEPNNPYSASKASADMMVRAYYKTYNTPVIITRGANNFGPYQYPEKVIPLFITNALDNIPLPIYGTGLNLRDYIYVTDHCAGIDIIMQKGSPGEIYNIGIGKTRNVIDLASLILDLMDKPKKLMKFVDDRPGHDRRYCLNNTKISGLGWKPQHSFETALEKTIKWYSENQIWWRGLKLMKRL
jgi:dTDP-glucose 4,6-dehydratase